MYNRYIPQPDGSYRRNSAPDKYPPAQSKPASAPCTPPPPPPCSKEPPCKDPIPPYPQELSGFLKRLLPQGFDTADLLVVVLLLLMADGTDKDRSGILLTLALYLIL